jgi:hypothetical protein
LLSLTNDSEQNRAPESGSPLDKIAQDIVRATTTDIISVLLPYLGSTMDPSLIEKLGLDGGKLVSYDVIGDMLVDTDVEQDLFIECLRLFSAAKHMQLKKTLPSTDIISEDHKAVSPELLAALQTHRVTEAMLKCIDAVAFSPVLGVKASALKKLCDDGATGQRRTSYLMPFEI